VELNDWILALHLLAAFALVGAEVMFSIQIASLWRTESTARVTSFMTLSRVATAMVIAGTLGTIVFGVWLAISIDGYELWDGWIIAAIVLWVIASELGRRAGNEYASAATRAGELAAGGTESSPEVAAAFGASRGFWLHIATSGVILVILIIMIWKPGA
jgi:uncharacterized membrane protein